VYRMFESVNLYLDIVYDTLIWDLNDYIHSLEKEIQDRKFENKRIANRSDLIQLAELSPSSIEAQSDNARTSVPESASPQSFDAIPPGVFPLLG